MLFDKLKDLQVRNTADKLDIIHIMFWEEDIQKVPYLIEYGK